MHRLLLTSSCIAMIAGAVPAWAAPGATQQTDDLGKNDADIVVTARKREERAIAVPQSITMVSPDTVFGTRPDALESLGRQLTNVVLNRRQDNEPNAVVRGIGSFGNVQGVGFYIDDVQNFTDQSATPGDVARIEVLKGPQGTLYGGSNVGGAIKYGLKQPTDQLGLEARADIASYGSSALFAALDVPLAGDVATRFVAYRNHHDGYIRNTLIGGRADRSTENAVRAALSWKIAPSVDVGLSYRHTDLRNGGNIYARVAAPNDYRRTVDYNIRPFNHRTVDAGTTQVVISGEQVKLTSITSYTTRSNRFRWDIDYSAVDALVVTNGDRNETEVITQELRLQSSLATAWNWSIGGYYVRVANRNPTINTNVELGVAAGGPFTIKNFSNGATTERNIAGFATIDYVRGPFAFTAGVRLDRVDFTGRVLDTPVVRTDIDRASLLPTVSLLYHIDGATNLYLTASRGAEPGRVNVTSGTGSTFRAETADSLEGGVKGSAVNGRLGYELAAFVIDSRRRQLETQFLSAGVFTEETINVGRAISFGFEANFRVHPVPRLQLSASAGYLNAHWRDRGAVVDLQSVDGREIPFAPQVSGTANAAYAAPLNHALEIRLSANAAYNGGFFWDAVNTARQSPYAVVDLGIALVRPKTGTTLRLDVRNITNARYHTEYISEIFGPGQSLGTTAQPVIVSIGAEVRL